MNLFFTSRKLHTFAAHNSLDTLLGILQQAVIHKSLPLTQRTHAQILTNGQRENPYIATKLITAYAECNSPTKSKLVFYSLNHKNVYLYNTLISGLVKSQGFVDALRVFKGMCCDGVVGFGECLRLFGEMTMRDSSSWNVVIAGFAAECGEEVWGVFRGMLDHGVRPSGFTISIVLPLCGGGNEMLGYGREIHCYVLRNGLDSVLGSDVHLGCCLVDMYSRNGKVWLGRKVFERMKRRNVFAWTAMINGYAKDSDFDEALVLFRTMQMGDGIEPNRVSLVSVLPACSLLAELFLGKQVHGFAIRKEFDHDVSLCNALIDMYAKCGNLYYARKVFDGGFFSKDAISWSSMICGYGLHGKGEEAIMLYEKMLRLGVKPDTITIVGVLSACSRSGLVDEGLKIYRSAIKDNGLEPTQEICSCVVDMLGRTGQLDQAFGFVKAMPIEPGPSVWGSLIRVSEIHGNSEMRDLAHRFLVQVEPENPSNYVGLSNSYASSERWDVAAQVRILMKDRGLKKAPGSTRITVVNY